MVDLPALHKKLFTSSAYVANPAFSTRVGWKRHGSGHMLVLKDTGTDAISIVVGEIIDDRCFCGPLANYNDKFPKPLKDTKNTFVLSHPRMAGFGKDFDLFHQTVIAIQSNITSTKDDQFFVAPTLQDSTAHFAAPAWEKRVCVFLQLCHQHVLTNEWP